MIVIGFPLITPLNCAVVEGQNAPPPMEDKKGQRQEATELDASAEAIKHLVGAEDCGPQPGVLVNLAKVVETHDEGHWYGKGCCHDCHMGEQEQFGLSEGEVHGEYPGKVVQQITCGQKEYSSSSLIFRQLAT